MNKTCKRCGKELAGKQTVYCTKSCCKLDLKAAYKRRNRDKVNAYNRAYRAKGRPPKNPAMLRTEACLKCGATEDLQLAHVKPLWAGGGHKTTITLCRNHHSHFDNLLRKFWQNG